ncbi:hypothetical protein BF2512_18 [Dickeya phage BF25/12]|uniref:Uncharacterized protein n=1 Tax=Dickeya phage BF25/12 TaxID=1698708 RepID=A0A219MH29_9CAUD|nr:hypothetical protein HOR10_gp18 [Dickeya phage BF25/12]ALA46475.1 hypothetical protein BF2512_18 [Dickeya phage BF25/12]
MGNFKIGDEAILVSVEPRWTVPVGTKVKILGEFRGSAGPGYSVELSTKPGSTIYYAAHRLGPVDDPLPPAPESGVYFNHNNSRKATLTAERGIVALGVDGTTRKVRLTAETALVLAHDLHRMAMEIRRKERNGD